MSVGEFGMIVVGALFGWWIVSWIIDKVRSKEEAPRREMPGPDDRGQP